MIDQPQRLSSRSRNAHKGSSGRILAVAGSRRYAGAAALCSLGAVRGGAGFVQAAVPSGIIDRIARSQAGIILHGLRQDAAGRLAFSAFLGLFNLMQQAAALVVGPGLDRSENLASLLERILAESSCPVVVDADALNLIADDPRGWRLGPQTVLTPHSGEASRLLGCGVEDVENDRVGALTELTGRYASIVVLKGPETLVGDGTRVYRNATGNPGMATAGMGDVLAGLIAALIPQTRDIFDASCQAVWAHGRAGDLAAEEVGRRGFLPEEVAHRIPRALTELEA